MFSKRICGDFSVVAKNAVKESVLSHLVDKKNTIGDGGSTAL